MSIEDDYLSIRPTEYQRIYDIAIQAGLKGDAWRVSRKTGKPIDPSDNIYQNSLWTFGGGDEPYLACIWWHDIDRTSDGLVYAGNSRENAEIWANMRTDIRAAGKTESRLGMKIKKAQAFSSLISTAYFARKPVRAAVLDGTRTNVEDAADDSSSAEKRLLDPASWWVHQYEASGAYELVRGIEPSPKEIKDPYNKAPELGADSTFLDWLENAPMTETEKDAIVKVRVGQGYFREALIERWKGCAVTQCKESALLLASHIKPWRKCTSRTERLSPDNGLLLTPHLDKLFDRGLITFSDTFKVILSSKLTLTSQTSLNINPGLQLRNRSFTDMKPYLEWHRDVEFIK